MKVTALRLQARNQNRVNVHLDGAFAFGLAKIEAVRLRLGQELTEADVAELQRRDAVEKAYERAQRLLAVRPRAETEIRDRLRRQKVADEAIDEVIGRLRQRGLVNDRAFAKLWVENRATFRPRSKRALQVELRRKGIEGGAAAEALGQVDDAEAAYRLAAKRAPRLKALPREAFRQKLGAYLARRGFDYATVGPVLERVWGELQQSARDP